MAEKLSIEQIRGRLTPVFEKYGVRRAVLFGSYAKGTATAKSDVDLFVDSGLRGLKFTGFLYDIERAAGVRTTGFLYDIERAAGVRTDVLDAADVTPRSAVEREIRDTGIVIYAK